VIRRGFWLTAGAVAGIYGYRRVSAVGRRLSASLNPASPGPGTARVAQGATRARPGAIAVARETLRFTRDVREGMEFYMARHSVPAGPTLSTDRGTDRETDRGTDRETHRETDRGTDHETHRETHDGTNHEPEDGH